MPRKGVAALHRRALRIEQVAEHPLYVFALTGREVLQIAEISRLSRSGNGALLGYQRPEVRRHIQNIVEYLNSDHVLFPNSIILALDSRVEFSRSRGRKGGDPISEAGILTIPLPKAGESKPAWIVDGQQRVIALSRSERPDLPIPVTVFIADDVETQRDQFLRINSAKPLPRGLITELLPEIDTVLPADLAAKKIPSALCEYLNRDPESPFCGLIRRPSLTKEQRRRAVITDTSLVRMLEDSFDNPSGCLFPYREIATGTTDFPNVVKVLILFWGCVREVFPEAWGRPPAQSRLMHGAGIRSMGKLMDRMMASTNPDARNAHAKISSQLQLVKPTCHWTKGHWEELGGVPWSSVQNTPSHIRSLSNVLVRAYMDLRGART